MLNLKYIILGCLLLLILVQFFIDKHVFQTHRSVHRTAEWKRKKHSHKWDGFGQKANNDSKNHMEYKDISSTILEEINGHNEKANTVLKEDRYSPLENPNPNKQEIVGSYSSQKSNDTQNDLKQKIVDINTAKDDGQKHGDDEDVKESGMAQAKSELPGKSYINHNTKGHEEIHKNDGNVKNSSHLDLSTILKLGETSMATKKRLLVRYFNSKQWNLHTKKNIFDSQDFETIPCYDQTRAFINFGKLIVNIKKSLSLVNSKMGPIIFLYLDSGRLEEFLNWLLLAKYAAKMNLNNLIVATDDTNLRPLLLKFSINIIFIDTNSTKPQIQLRQVIWTYRIILWRLLTSSGYDVFSFDTDAIVLHDPIQHVDRNYPHASIVASITSKAPKNVMREWGFTLCMGIVLFRTELKTHTSFWGFLDDMCMALGVKAVDDQRMINEVLLGAGIIWNNSSQQVKHPFSSLVNITGVTKDGLVVIALSSRDFCRLTCYKNRKHYVWHTRSDHKNWLLKNDWKDLLGRVNDITLLVNQTLYLKLKTNLNTHVNMTGLRLNDRIKS